MNKNLQFLPILILLLVLFGPVQSQTLKHEIGTPSNPGYKKSGSLRGCAGIIGDNYYLLEQDFGGGSEFNSNEMTIVTVYSVTNQKLKKRFNLHQLVAKRRTGISKIKFYDVVVWKNKIIGLYTYKRESRKEFEAGVMICDPDGNPVKEDIDIGEFRLDYKQGSFLWQGGSFIKGRITMSGLESIQYRFNSDSSRIIVLTNSNKESANIKFKIYNSDFSEITEVETLLPLQDKVADLLDFSMNRNGEIFLLTKTYKSKSERKKIADDDDYYNEIFLVRSNATPKLSSIPINLPAKTINTASLVYHNDNVFCIGNYWNTEVKKARGNCNGFFSLKIDPQNLTSSKPIAYPLPDSVTGTWVNEKDIKKGTGIEFHFELMKTIPHATGIYCIYNANVYTAYIGGPTRALNSSNEMTRGMMICNVDPNGTIKWANGMWYASGNAMAFTRTDRPLFGMINNDLFCFYTTFFDKQNASNGLFYNSFQETNGAKNQKVKIVSLPVDLETSETVENTIQPIGRNAYIMALVNGVEINSMKIKSDQ